MSNRLLSFLTIFVFFGLIAGFFFYTGTGSKKAYTIVYEPSDTPATVQIRAGDILLSTHSCEKSPCLIEYRYKKDLRATLTASGYETASFNILGASTSIDLLASLTEVTNGGTNPESANSAITGSTTQDDIIIPASIAGQADGTTLISSITPNISLTLPVASDRIVFAYISPTTQILHVITSDGLIQADTTKNTLSSMSMPHPIAHDMIPYMDGVIMLSRELNEQNMRTLEYRTTQEIRKLASVSQSIAALEVRGETLYLYDRDTKKWSSIRL